jgi:hypothetical protein
LRVNALGLVTCGCILTGICGFATWWSIRIAIGDWRASAGTIDGYRQALRLAPEDPELRAREALYRLDEEGESSDGSASVVDELRLAAKMNPYNSTVLMALGLQTEFRGDNVGAEAYLKHAVEADHQFKPAWTLANFYYRTNQREKSWPLIERILQLEPLGFDPGPVFELAWNELADEVEMSASRKIERMIPARSEKPLQYLQFLVRTKRTEAAMDAWPKALAAYQAADSEHASAMIDFADYLVANERISDAVSVWNQLVERGILPAEPLTPSAGKSIADPDFQFPALGKAFGWRVAEVPGVFTSKPAGSLRIEISGDEPEMFGILGVVAPVRSRVAYRLRWKMDSSALRSPHDPGFSFQIVQEPGGQITQCGPSLSVSPSTCDFLSSAEAKSARISLRYARAQGTVRVSGVMQVSSVQLELAK